MTDHVNLPPSTLDTPYVRVSDQPWPGPLGHPGLTGEQRRQLAEDRVLAAAAGLDPDDHRLEANIVRETAADIRDHRAAAASRAAAEFAQRTAEREAALAKFRADPEDPGRLDAVELVRAREITLDAAEYRQLTTEIDTRLSRAGGASRAAAGSASLDAAPVRMLVPRSIVEVARRDWQRLADLPLSARVGYLIDQVWQHGYQHGYRTAHTTLTRHVAATATEAAATNPTAWHSLHQLSVAAAEAGVQAATRPLAAAPADQRTVIAGQIAAGRENSQSSGQQPPWRQAVDIAWAGSVSAGAIAGQLAAATDVLAGWRNRGGHRLAETGAVDGRPVRAWLDDLLGGINQTVASQIGRQIANQIVAGHAATTQTVAREDAAGATRTQPAVSPRDAAGPVDAVRLARQDQAPGVPVRTVGPNRAQPPPTPTQPPAASRRR